VYINPYPIYDYYFPKNYVHLKTQSNKLKVGIFFKELENHGAHQRYLLWLDGLINYRIDFEIFTGDDCSLNPSVCNSFKSALLKNGISISFVSGLSDETINYFMNYLNDFKVANRDILADRAKDGVYMDNLLLSAICSSDAMINSEYSQRIRNSIVLLRKYDFIIASNTFGDAKTNMVLAIVNNIRNGVCDESPIESKFPKLLIDLPNFPIPYYWLPYIDVVIVSDYILFGYYFIVAILLSWNFIS